MMDVTFDKQTRTLTFTHSGMVSVADMNAVNAKIEDSAGPDFFVRVRGSVSNVKILLDWEALEGWESGTKPLGTTFGMDVRDAVSRVAVIADRRWHDEQDRLADVLKSAKVRFFTPDQRAAAIEWLAS
jgi:hypothetical protein